MKPLIVLTWILGLSLLPTSARAQSASGKRAAQLDEEGRARTKTGDYRGALKLYEEALALEATPKRQCNVGAAYFKLDEWARAHFFLGVCLSHSGQLPASALVPMSQALAYAEKQLREGDFTLVSVSSEPKGARVRIPTLAGSIRFVAPRRLWLPPGEHRYEAEAEGFDTRAESFAVQAAASGQAQDLVIVLSAEKKVAAVEVDPVDAETDATADIVPSVTAEPDPSPRARAPSRLPAWIALSTGAGLAIAGGVFHVRAAGIRSDLEGMNSGQERTGRVEDLKRERSLMAGFYSVGALALGIGGYLLFSAQPQEPEPRPQLRLDKGGASLGLGWAF